MTAAIALTGDGHHHMLLNSVTRTTTQTGVSVQRMRKKIERGELSDCRVRRG